MSFVPIQTHGTKIASHTVQRARVRLKIDRRINVALNIDSFIYTVIKHCAFKPHGIHFSC